MLFLNDSLGAKRHLTTLIENRTTYGLANAELNLFETHQQCKGVLLTFPDPVLASMIMGKKVMRLNDLPDFEFLPGESVILPSNETMEIDFPEASLKKPTKCLALRFNKDKLQQIVHVLNERKPKDDGAVWQVTDYNFHFTNDVGINQILQRLIFLFSENHVSKDLFSDLMIEELLIRILQLESKEAYLKKSLSHSNSSRFAFVIDFIRQNLNEDLAIGLLSQKANMSESHFYRAFKNELGVSPNEFILEEKMKTAESILRMPEQSIKEAYLSAGFNSFSYFCRMFKKRYKVQPSEYRQQFLSQQTPDFSMGKVA